MSNVAKVKDVRHQAQLFYKRLSLTNGLHTLVDIDLFDYINQWKWARDATRRNYVIKVSGRNLKDEERRLHRIIMDAKDGEEIDHIDGNPLNNRRINLRFVTHKQNSRNRRIGRNNVSGYKGVVWVDQEGKWRAQLRVDGKLKYFGFYDNKIDAAKAYDKAAKKYFGEFARLNQYGEK